MPEYLVYCKKGKPASAENLRLVRNMVPATRLYNVREQITARLRPGESFIRRIGHSLELGIEDVLDNIGQLHLDPDLLTKDGPAGHIDLKYSGEQDREIAAKRAGCTFRDLFPEIELPGEEFRFPVTQGSDGTGKPLHSSEIMIPEASFMGQILRSKDWYVDRIIDSVRNDGPFTRIATYEYFRFFNRAVNVHSLPHGYWLRIPSAELIRTLLGDAKVHEKIMEMVKGTGITHIACSNIFIYHKGSYHATQDTVNSRWFSDRPLGKRHMTAYTTGMVELEDPSKTVCCEPKSFSTPLIILEKTEY